MSLLLVRTSVQSSLHSGPEGFTCLQTLSVSSFVLGVVGRSRNKSSRALSEAVFFASSLLPSLSCLSSFLLRLSSTGLSVSLSVRLFLFPSFPRSSRYFFFLTFLLSLSASQVFLVSSFLFVALPSASSLSSVLPRRLSCLLLLPPLPSSVVSPHFLTVWLPLLHSFLLFSPFVSSFLPSPLWDLPLRLVSSFLLLRNVIEEGRRGFGRWRCVPGKRRLFFLLFVPSCRGGWDHSGGRRGRRRCGGWGCSWGGGRERKEGWRKTGAT